MTNYCEYCGESDDCLCYASKDISKLGRLLDQAQVRSFRSNRIFK